jgi:hypothetical protein
MKPVWRAEERGAVAGAASARSAPRPHEIANGEIEADEHHERDKPLIALGRAPLRNDKHAWLHRATPLRSAPVLRTLFATAV